VSGGVTHSVLAQRDQWKYVTGVDGQCLNILFLLRVSSSWWSGTPTLAQIVSFLCAQKLWRGDCLWLANCLTFTFFSQKLWLSDHRWWLLCLRSEYTSFGLLAPAIAPRSRALSSELRICSEPAMFSGLGFVCECDWVGSKDFYPENAILLHCLRSRVLRVWIRRPHPPSTPIVHSICSVCRWNMQEV